MHSASGNDLELQLDRYGFGISWDAVPGKSHVDVDLQCVIVDGSGVIFECVYYNNLRALGAVTHSGDESTGAADGIDELIWVTNPKLPEKAALLVFVLAAYSGGKLADVENGMFHVLEGRKTNEVAKFQMQSDGAVHVAAVMFRGSKGWSLRIVDKPAQDGQHFMDILPSLSDVIRSFIPSAPKRQKVAFAMEKGCTMAFPSGLKSITVGLGWDVDDSLGEVDLDVSAVLLSADGKEVETVFFGNLESTQHGVKHTGDNLTGEGDGDDEQILVQLETIGAEVQFIVFVINIYSQGISFLQVSKPFCRVFDSTGELCRYCLDDAGDESGLVVSKLSREVGGRWDFHALGLPCRGRTYKDSLPAISSICSPQASTPSSPAVSVPIATGMRWSWIGAALITLLVSFLLNALRGWMQDTGYLNSSR